MKIASLLATVALLGACDARAPDRALSEPVAEERFDLKEVAAAKVALIEEATIEDVMVNMGDAVEWHIGVISDGTARHGFAEYVCLQLSERGLVDDDTDIRIVDMMAVARGEDFRSASLGRVNCATGERAAV